MAKKPALPKDFLFSKETAEAMGCIARSGLIAESATRFWIEGDIPIESHEGRRYGWEIPPLELMLSPRGYFFTTAEEARTQPDPKREILCRFSRTCPALAEDKTFYVDGCADLPGKGTAVYSVYSTVPRGAVAVHRDYIEYFDLQCEVWRPAHEWGCAPSTSAAKAPILPDDYLYRMERRDAVLSIANNGFKVYEVTYRGFVDGVPYESHTAKQQGWEIPSPDRMTCLRAYFYTDLIASTRRHDSDFRTLCRFSRKHPALADDSMIFVDGGDDVLGEGRVLYAIFPHAKRGDVVIEPGAIEYFDRKHSLWRSLAVLSNTPSMRAAGWAQELGRYQHAFEQGVKVIGLFGNVRSP